MDIKTIIEFTLIGLGLLLVLVTFFQFFVRVSGQEIKTLERRMFGKSMPKDRVFAMKDEIGRQARTLGPGWFNRDNMVIPFIYKTKSYPFTIIRDGYVGTVISRDGAPIPAGKIFAKKIDCNLFQDGESFLNNGGEKGPQLTVIPPGQYRINPELFFVNPEVKIIDIKEGEVGLVEAKDGKPIPAGRIFGKIVECENFQNAEAFLNNGGEIGPQLKTLNPGQYRINDMLFKVTPVPVTIIQKVGVITATDGLPIAEGRILAKVVPDHKNFQDAEAWLQNGGERGPQSEILLPGKYRIHTGLFKVVERETTIVPAKKVGLVTARDGQPLPETEYVAKPVEGHNNFQDVSVFLKAGGQRGPQFDILKPGTYYINPLMFDVEFDDVAEVARGQVAVLISNVGKEPVYIKEIAEKVAKHEKSGVTAETVESIKENEKRLDVGIERYVVSKEYRGIQQEVAGPGTYYLNRRAYIPYIIDTTNITIDWDENEKTPFDPLLVVSHDGFGIKVSVKVVIRVRPDQAPYMIAKIGSIQNLVDHVVHPMIDSSFRNQASATGAMNFMQNRHEEQEKAELRTRLELEKYHVELVSVLICQIELPENLMKTQTDRIIALQQQAMYQEQQKTERERIARDKTAAEADKQRDLVQSEINVKIADNNKIVNIKNAEGDGESIRLRKAGEAQGIESIGRAEAVAIEAKGSATAEAYEKQKQAVGNEGVIAIQVAQELGKGNVKVTPDFVVGSGGAVEGLLSTYLTKQVMGTQNQ